jgi:ribonuclease HI
MKFQQQITRFFSKTTELTPPPSIPPSTQQTKPTIIFTDGACIHNGYPNAKAGIGVFFGVNDPRNISTRVRGKQSNNTAELTAVIEAIRIILPITTPVLIVSDSIYAIRCATTYGKTNSKGGWKKDIPNKELVKSLYELVSSNSQYIQFRHIMAHTGSQDPYSIGNEYADTLATNSLKH